MNIAYIIGGLISFAGSLIYGLTGLGYSMLTIPALIILFPPKTVIAIALLHATIIAIIVTVESLRHINFKHYLPLIISGIIGIPIGTYILVIINPGLLKIVIGIFTILSTIAFILGYQKKIKNEKIGFVIIGFISGILNGSIKASSVPIALFLSNQGSSKKEFRAVVAIFFTITNLIAIPLFAIAGLLTTEVFKYSLIWLPPVLLGVTLGSVFSKSLREDVFNKSILIILIIAGILSTLSGFGVI